MVRITIKGTVRPPARPRRVRRCDTPRRPQPPPLQQRDGLAAVGYLHLPTALVQRALAQSAVAAPPATAPARNTMIGALSRPPPAAAPARDPSPVAPEKIEAPAARMTRVATAAARRTLRPESQLTGSPRFPAVRGSYSAAGSRR